MHNYQQIIPQIRIGGAINYALDARFTHDGSLQGIIEGIMRPETQIPGANEASTYVIKSHIIMQLYAGDDSAHGIFSRLWKSTYADDTRELIVAHNSVRSSSF